MMMMMSRFDLLLLWLLVMGGRVYGEEDIDLDGGLDDADDVPLFRRCDINDYYEEIRRSGPPSVWTKEALAQLVTFTHRNELPLLGDALGDDDIYQAMMDLDKGTKPNTVRLIYRDINMNATPYGNPLYWDVERLWPLERGSSRPSLAFTDVHHIRPADYSVLQFKGPLSFGACNTVEFLEFCTRPATLETANDTAQDGKVWLPPARFRGDIARALLYVDLRYGTKVGSLQRSLSLQDCGPFGDYGLGYLSQLLQWAATDPVDVTERMRNNRACSRWQGNRNPFVDYPQLIQSIYGQPQPLLEGTLTYRSCIDIPTPAPTATPNQCSNLRPGDIPFYLMNSDDPDEVVFFPITDIPGGIQLSLTDKAWDGRQFLSTEGTASLTVPENGIQSGTNFGYGGPSSSNLFLKDAWDVTGDFQISADGDNLFLYCIDADDLPHFISAMSYAGSGQDNDGNVQEVSWWFPSGLSANDYGTKYTALPEDLENAGALFLPVHYDNYLYNGTRVGGIGLLRIKFVDERNWEGANDGRYQLDDSASSSSATTTMPTMSIPFLCYTTAILMTITTALQWTTLL